MREIPAVQEPVTEFARSRGWRARRMAYLGRRNCPDSWFFKGGEVIVVEFKNLDDEPNIGQLREHARLREAGLKVYVIDNVSDGNALFE